MLFVIYLQKTMAFLYWLQSRLLRTRIISSITAVPDPSSVAPGEPSVVSKCELRRMALSSQERSDDESSGQDKRTIMLVTLVYALNTTILLEWLTCQWISCYHHPLTVIHDVKAMCTSCLLYPNIKLGCTRNALCFLFVIAYQVFQVFECLCFLHSSHNAYERWMSTNVSLFAWMKDTCDSQACH